ncbi:MAG: CotH kinase family protein [Bacteroidaceae bacterium]|nr:CotH kinase family protein [Bacteroidaceae bacterium]
MMKRTAFLYCMLLMAPIALRAEEVDSLLADTMYVDWYVSPVPTIPLPSFDEMVEVLRQGDASSNVVDYSEAENIEIAEPWFAWVNIKGLTSFPMSKTDIRQVWVEVHDGHGGYFRKRALLKGQGGWSLKFPKRNFSCQFCDDDWTGTTTPDIRIGDWVKQDAFHFKAFYTDFCRGIGEIGYKLFRSIVADRPPYWERGGYTKASKRARCFPDGFPCAVYVDGAFQGLYAWQLKKSRKNMNMEKTNELHIHLDGNLNNSTLFRGYVGWSQFDIQHPKAPFVTDNTKAAILQLSRYHAELEALEKSGADSLSIKRAFEQRFDIASLLDYDVFYQFVCNCDGSLKNWQWFTYDGRKWLVAPYDLDQTFGLNLYGVVRPAVWEHSPLIEGPFYWVENYYQKELRQRYAELRANGALSAANILPIVDDWYSRVSEAMYEQEKIRWPDSPCYGSAICNAGWKPCPDWAQYKTTPDYSATAKYKAGDVCKLEGRLWEATLSVTGVRPYQRNSQLDSLQRLEQWVTERIAYLDEEYRLHGIPQQIQPTRHPKTNEVYYNLQGLPVNRPQRGIYIKNGKKMYIE